MTSLERKFSRRYTAALESFLEAPSERLLQVAYELGRSTAGSKLGVLDMARVHRQALVPCLAQSRPGPGLVRALKSAEFFFLEALSPFEAVHRGFREANQELQRLNAVQEQRNAELAAMNRRLQVSREHYRQLFHRARLLQQRLRRVSGLLLHVQEEERKRISRELHDEVGQALAAINMNLGMLQRDGDANGALLKQSIADSLSLVQRTFEAVHRFACELRPAMLDELGLVPALRSYAKDFAARAGWRLRFRGNSGSAPLSSEQKTVLFRIAQESLTNVAKHAQASRVSVTLNPRPSSMRLEIKDDGRAFNVGQQLSVGGVKHLGLLGMQERVRLVNGRLAVTSVPGKGTSVHVEIPLNGADRSWNQDD